MTKTFFLLISALLLTLIQGTSIPLRSPNSPLPFTDGHGQKYVWNGTANCYSVVQSTRNTLTSPVLEYITILGDRDTTLHWNAQEKFYDCNFPPIKDNGHVVSLVDTQ